MIELVGLSGYARSGKDEAAKALAELGYKRLAFADKLRECLYALNPTIVDEESYYPRTYPLEWVVDAMGWDEAKIRFSGVRNLMQRMGTEVGRKILGENVWVDLTFKDLAPGKYVVTDCRFVNEADGIRARGGRVIRINRPSVGPVNNHASETSLDHYAGFWATINNDTTLDEFHNKVRSAI